MRQLVVLRLPPREEAVLTHVEVEAFQATVPGRMSGTKVNKLKQKSQLPSTANPRVEVGWIFTAIIQYCDNT